MTIIPQFTKTDSELQRVIDDPCASYWLKDAIRALIKRDCVDAANDAQLLARLMQQRTDEILRRN